MHLLPEYMPSQLNTIHHTDALAHLRALPDGYVNCIVTSPPYYNLRDYGVPGQIGLEDTPDAYIERLVRVFREAWRVLADDGTFWLNLGDSYAANRGYQVEDNKHRKNLTNHMGMAVPVGLKPKDLMFIPHRVAMALQADGWYVRQDIVWNKPNCMPESVTDRPTRSHEYVFLLSKSERYHYDADAIKECAQDWGTRDRSNGKYESDRNESGLSPHNGLKGTPKQDALGKRTYTGFNARYFSQKQSLVRNKRSVWNISTEAFPGSHFAVMPTKLVQDCIAAGCPADGVVYDPFSGSGTVGLVAMRLGRRYIGSELNREYVEMARQRIAKADPLQPTVTVTGEVQLSLFADTA